MIETTKQSAIETWFDDLISTLRSHQVQLETNTAQNELKKFYEKLLTSTDNELAHLGKATAQKHFIPRIIFDYIELVSDVKPVKLAFDFNDSEVLVWAEVKEGDAELEKKLLRAEAIINSKYHDFGFDMETTVVESGDRLTVPNHYKLYKS